MAISSSATSELIYGFVSILFLFFVHGYIPILVIFLGLLVSSFLTLGSMSV